VTNRSAEQDASKSHFLYHVMNEDLSLVKNALQNHNFTTRRISNCVTVCAVRVYLKRNMKFFVILASDSNK